jgi:hypothetical protein
MSLFFSFSYNILVAGIYTLNTYCLGYVITQSFTKGISNKLIKVIFQWVIGWNVIVFLVHILGLLSVLNSITYFFLSFSGLLFFVFFNRKLLFDNFSEWKENYLSYRKQLAAFITDNKFSFGLLLIFIIMMGLISLAPLSKADELTYHCNFVKRIVDQGGILFDYDMIVSFQPMAQQLWYVPVYGLEATEAPALLNLFTSFFIIFLSYSWLIKYTGRKTALLTILATYLSLSGISGYPAPSDNVACWLWSLAALVVTYEFLYSKEPADNPNLRFFILGIIYATACLVKITNLPLVFFCIIAVLLKPSFDKTNYRQLIWFFIPFAVFYLPFLIRIYIWTGSPFFPAFASILGSPAFDLKAMSVYLQRPSLHWQDNIFDNLHYIYRMLRHSFLYNLSPLLIIVSPIATIFLLLKRKYLIGFVIITYYFVWFFSPASSRLLCGFSTFLVLTLFVQKWKLVENKYASGLIKIHALILVLFTAIYFTQFGWYVFGLDTKKEFLKTKVQTFQEIEWANRKLPKGSKILTTTGQKYYFDFPVYSLEEYPLLMGEDARKIKSPEDAYLFVKKHGISHLFIAGTGKHFNDDFVKLLTQTGDKYGQVLYEKENVTIRGVRHPLNKPVFGKVIIYELL